MPTVPLTLPAGAPPAFHLLSKHTIQTNGTLVDDEWAAFFKQNNFLVGISIDGPRAMHDVYRQDKGGAPTFDKVMRGLAYLMQHGVEQLIVQLLRQNRAPSELTQLYATRDQEWQALLAKTGRNDPCPCGSGQKFKHCHGRESISPML